MDTVTTFARLYLQTLALSLLFVGTGEFLYRTVSAAARHDAAGMRWARGYFIGISAFLPVFVLLSRIVGAQVALWISLGVMAALSLLEVAAMRRDAPALRPPWKILAALLMLVALYSVTNAALWLLGTAGSAEPGIFHHFGSIHAGRYANYAIYIAEFDRVPYLAQNGGQSILSSLHLLLGSASPLAALMVWLPFSMAFLTLLVFGLFRSAGFRALPCAAATMMVMLCNIAISGVHVLVFDNGSPLAFIGYTDLIIGVGTFILFCRWFQSQLVEEAPRWPAQVVVPALLGATWTWYAPQNLVIAAGACAATTILWAWRYGLARAKRRLAAGALVFVAAAGLGATQFGTFLPASQREDTGYWTQQVPPTVAFRPYIQYVRNHWTGVQWKSDLENGRYSALIHESRSIGWDELYRNVAWRAEDSLWDSLRVYGFPLLGLLLLGAHLRKRAPPQPGGTAPALRAWLSLSAFAFAFGYLLVFTLELAQMKWWLTRFLVPGTAMALTCLGFAALGGLGSVSRTVRRGLWTLLLVSATFAPLAELTMTAYRNFQAPDYSLRIRQLAGTTGPFFLEALGYDARIATRNPRGFTIGGEGRPQGLALYNAPVPLRPGRYRVGFWIAPITPPAQGTSMLEVDIVIDRGNTVVAKRAFAASDLERRPDGLWAWLEFAVDREVKDAQFRLWRRSDAAFLVGDVQRARLQAER